MSLPPVEELDFSCEDDEGCSAGHVCVSGECWPSHLDAGLEADAIVADSGTPDRGPTDVGADAGMDAGVDAGPADVSPDQVALDVATPDTTSIDAVTADASLADHAVADLLVPDSALPDSATSDATPAETLNPTDLTLTARFEEVWLQFTVPDLPEVRCDVRSSRDGSYPADHNDGDLVQSFTSPGGQYLVDSALTADQLVHYAVFCTSTLGWNDAVVEGANADTVTPLPAWWSDGWDWQRRRRLVLDNSARGLLLDFPVLVHLTASRIAYNRCAAEGIDLRFVGADGSALAYEIDEWNSNGSSYIWVKVPRLEASSTTGYVYMYYDNSGAVASTQNPAAVWSNGYVAVYHLGADLSDSTAGGHDGQVGPSATLATTTGQVGQGRIFDGADDYIELPDEQAFDLAAGFTVSLWFQVNQFSARRQALIAKGSQAWQLNRDDNNSRLAFGTTRNDNQTLELLVGSTDVSGGDWFLATAVFDDVGNDRLLYINSTEDGADTFNRVLYTTDDLVRIGDNAGDPGRRFNGSIDEVRVSSAARTVDWITAQHASMSDALFTYASQDENL